MKKELLFESKVAAKFMQTAGLSEETRRNLIEEMYGAKMDEFGEVYEQEEDMDPEAPEAPEDVDMDPEAPKDVDMGPEAPEDVDMDSEAPEDVGMEPADAEKAKVLADVVKQLSAALGIEDQVEVSGLEDEGEPAGEPAGMEPLKEMGKMHDELEEMDDEVLEETVRAILAK